MSHSGAYHPVNVTFTGFEFARPTLWQDHWAQLSQPLQVAAESVVWPNTEEYGGGAWDS